MAAKYNMLGIIENISQIISKYGHDGALDKDNKPVKIGLKREEGHPLLDSRVMDGFKIFFSEDKMKICYHSEASLRDVHDKNFESEIEETINSVAKFLKKEFKNETGKALSLTPIKDEETKIEVRSLSRIRTWVEASKWYKIGGIDADEISKSTDEDKVKTNIRNWIENAKKAKKPENVEIKPSDNEREEIKKLEVKK